MNIKTALFTAAIFLGLTGCSSTQQVTLAKQSIPNHVMTVSQVKQEDNSKDMDANLIQAVNSSGLQMKGSLPQGTAKSKDVDALISYQDTWRWDLVMYLKSVSVNLYDAKTGDLLVIGSWENSALHSFPDSGQVVRNLLNEMVNKVRAAERATSVN